MVSYSIYTEDFTLPIHILLLFWVCAFFDFSSLPLYAIFDTSTVVILPNSCVSVESGIGQNGARFVHSEWLAILSGVYINNSSAIIPLKSFAGDVMSTPQFIRRPKINMTPISLNYLHLKNPWVVAWWSLCYPGFGHLTLGSMGKGIFVFAGELVVNYMAHINLSILYSFTGEFQQAKDILNTQWLLIYCAVLVFAIWDSYRLTIECNKFSVLADREYAPFSPVTALGSASFNAFEKRNRDCMKLCVNGKYHLKRRMTIYAKYSKRNLKNPGIRIG